MASGWSTRFGKNKLMESYNSKPLIQYIIEKIQKLGAPAIVVTRYEDVRKLTLALNIPCITHHELYQNDTIRLGLEALGPSYTGYMFCTADQPLVSTKSLVSLLENFAAAPDYIHRLAFNNQPGNPVIFPAAYYDALCVLPQDQGGSYIIKQNKNQLRFTEAGSELELYDIDTAKDLLKLKQLNT